MKRMEELPTRKRVPVSGIKPGMYVVGLDRSWLQTPFLFHRKLIKSVKDIDMLKKSGIREVVIDISRGTDVESAESIVETEANKWQASEGAKTTSAVGPEVPISAETAIQSLAEELQAAQTIHQHALAAAQSIFDGVGGGARVNGEVARKVVGDLLSSINRSPEANLLLMQMRRLQEDSFVHSVNVCVLSLVVNTYEKFESDGSDACALGLGALLHDVGETRIPRNLTRKKDSFSDVERRLLEEHPRLGAMLLEECDGIPMGARRIVLEHHERIDGSGYPRRSRAGDISLLSQIVAITDSYDDMLSGRTQAVIPPVEVLGQLFVQSNSGTLDRGLIERIIRCLGVYPVGSLVELNTGERAIVVAANRADTLRPIVKIIASRTGAIQPRGPIMSLANCSADERCIVGALDPGKERLDPLAFLRFPPAIAG
jgi:HD-GYP domain-containing protein (c-di-GMP phosphodiesterase class II)